MLSIEPNVDKQARMDDMALEKLKGSDKQKTIITILYLWLQVQNYNLFHWEEIPEDWQKVQNPV